MPESEKRRDPDQGAALLRPECDREKTEGEPRPQGIVYNRGRLSDCPSEIEKAVREGTRFR